MKFTWDLRKAVSNKRKHGVTVFAEIKDDEVRIISARRATKRERRQ